MQKLRKKPEIETCPFRFSGELCIRNFLEWLHTLTEDDTRQVRVLAHNFQGYDGYFILEEFWKKKELWSGGKVLQVTFDGISFIDSPSFFQMPLSVFPKTFGLSELKQGYFPHLFNHPENQYNTGPLPDKKHYMPESMSTG